MAKNDFPDPKLYFTDIGEAVNCMASRYQMVISCETIKRQPKISFHRHFK